jgi:5-methylcytosine-specific restriction endonuclease McrA
MSLSSKEKARIRSYRYFIKNKEKVYEANRTAAKLNPDKKKEQSLKSYYKNKEKNSAKRLSPEFKAKKAETDKIWRQKNQDKQRQYSHNKRAAKRNSQGKFTAGEWANLKEIYNHSCANCMIRDSNLTVDHIIPLSKGGSNSLSNIQPLCLSCNCSKSAKAIVYIGGIAIDINLDNKLIDGDLAILAIIQDENTSIISN